MERGVISLTNLELVALYHMAIAQHCTKQDLMDKLQPVKGVDDTDSNVVQISEDDAEILLDCMPIPDEKSDPNIVSSRIKIQEFVSKCRFGD